MLSLPLHRQIFFDNFPLRVSQFFILRSHKLESVGPLLVYAMTRFFVPPLKFKHILKGYCEFILEGSEKCP